MTSVMNVESLVTMPTIVPDPPEVPEVVAVEVEGEVATEDPEVEADLDHDPQDAEEVSLVADLEVQADQEVPDQAGVAHPVIKRISILTMRIMARRII